jgi:5'-nucleotidase
MRLLIDQDEVLAQFTTRILEWWNEDHDTDFKVEDIKHYWLEKTLGPRSAYFIKSCMRDPRFFADLEPIDGAISGMEELNAMGHELIIASKVPLNAGIGFYGKVEWIRKYLPWFDLSNFVGIQNKTLLGGDVLLDDSPSNVKLFSDAGRRAVIFDRPWNRDLPGLRARSWFEFVRMVESAESEGTWK